jgi:hypothetical protein
VFPKPRHRVPIARNFAALGLFCDCGIFATFGSCDFAVEKTAETGGLRTNVDVARGVLSQPSAIKFEGVSFMH